SGGEPPYEYSLNGITFTNQNQFAYLGPENYIVTVRDANGCLTELFVDLAEPEEMTVRLVAVLEGNNIIELGDSVQLQVQVNVPEGQQIEQIIWAPADSVDCKGEGCLNPIVYPELTTTYSVTVITDRGCQAEDKLTIFIEKSRPVFIPNAFSPDGDGHNDQFVIFGGSQIKEIQSFLVFNRWGETIYQYHDFEPNNPTYGWDGKHRGQLMNPAVFAYFAKIEFTDGEVRIYEGDVTLMR
ncbi:MAG: gliding motility-associated C-terminal domain-containing protein, partial [Bacteroidetes bacterium]|nr:gliding motility-associated C-terminal domain-containing protein [Bacteroidota bacterium]